MKVEYINKESTRFESNYIQIVYNNKVYGEWDNDANIDYPEDLIIGRDLNYLIDIGIEIGKQMEKDSKK